MQLLQLNSVDQVIDDSIVLDVNSRERALYEAKGYVLCGWETRSSVPGLGQIRLVKPSKQVEDAFHIKVIKPIASLSAEEVNENGVSSFRWIMSAKNDPQEYVVGRTAKKTLDLGVKLSATRSLTSRPRINL